MNWRKLVLTVCLLVALGGATGQTAQASSLRVVHKPWNKMTRHQKVVVLKKQIFKDHSVIRFWHNHTDLWQKHSDIANRDVHWARVSLPIATANLKKLTAHYVSYSGSVPQLICNVFKSACSMALRVARRESGFSIYAANGQYLGIFQMGSAERAKFATIGYSTAYEQIIAAHNYFLVSGWSPWSQTAY